MRPNLRERLLFRLNERAELGTRRSLPGPLAGVDFVSNDYLGFARGRSRPLRWDDAKGGATGSRLLSGDCAQAHALEKLLAQLFNCESALVFNSGYTANVGLLPCIAQAGDVLLLDELAHTSLKDGARLSKAQAFYFRHNDLQHLQSRLERLSKRADHVFVVAESVYSMDGDVVPLLSLLELCESYGAALILDEAHALGTLGEWGEGVASTLNCEGRVFARILTFGKALGVHGAAVLGPALLKDYLVNFCHSFIYTTALPQHTLLGIQKALLELGENRAPFKALQSNIQVLNQLFASAGLTGSQTPIFSVRFQELSDLRAAAAQLRAAGLCVLPIYSPTVRRGTERLRICLHSFNKEEEIQLLAKELLKYAPHFYHSDRDGSR